MTTAIGIRELKQNASQVVARAARGETLTVTDRGRPVARLVPLAESRRDQLLQEGRLRAATRSLADLPEPLPAARPSLSELLIADREDRL
ncbi:MAG: type II toxin-antitoxin system prevent-host-death family antitoxin [Bifidobacteriaceae bacterium]|jgi:prevent-host-death family protein|nr:type II toxin-antitoxin system prevent-host-death family antitoxin [Bifidobacteriaceae bacterium]